MPTSSLAPPGNPGRKTVGGCILSGDDASVEVSTHTRGALVTHFRGEDTLLLSDSSRRCFYC
jgi:hypothetical protein